jgi:hypothetical protein
MEALKKSVGAPAGKSPASPKSKTTRGTKKRA